MLLTTDMIIEGTHFNKYAKPYRIGWKSMAVNISDIASMGGIPKYALISVGIPRSKNITFLKEITRGIEAICRKFNVHVIGGDINGSDKTVVNVALIGEAKKKNLVTRSGARVDDLIFVTGVLGEGRFKHLSFLPRLKEACILTTHFKINAMIDLSDGLAMDLNRLARASGVGAYIYESLIPLSRKSETIKKALFSGEDFELLFTVSTSEAKKIIKRMGKKEDLPISLIGKIVNKRLGVRLVEENARLAPLRPKGFAHL